MDVSVGTDTYGRVKKVGSTPIVTKFWMLQALPVYPLESYYFIRFGESETSGVPFVASSQCVAIDGIALDRVDRVSVVMAYVRGFFATLTLVGFISIIPIIMYFTGEHLDRIAWMMLRGLIACFVIGVTGGLLTYVIPLTSSRERQIRAYCGERLGICADPARVSADTAEAIEQYVALQDVPEGSRLALIGELISCRCRIAGPSTITHRADAMTSEGHTDQLLDRLNAMRD